MIRSGEKHVLYLGMGSPCVERTAWLTKTPAKIRQGLMMAVPDSDRVFQIQLGLNVLGRHVLMNMQTLGWRSLMGGSETPLAPVILLASSRGSGVSI